MRCPVGDWMQSRRGIDFVDVTIPALVAAVSRLGDKLEKYGKSSLHPYVGEKGYFTEEGRMGTIVSVNETVVAILMSDGSHSSGGIADLSMANPERAAALVGNAARDRRG